MQRHLRARLDEIDVAAVVFELPRIAADHGFRLAPEFTTTAKTLLHLDTVVGALAPETLMKAALEMRDFAGRLPRRVNSILDAVANNELEVKVDAIDEALLTEVMQDVAKRISLSLVLAALVVGAALLARVETPFTIFGYPVIAIVLFLFAAGGAVALVIDIVLNDRRQRRRSRQR